MQACKTQLEFTKWPETSPYSEKKIDSQKLEPILSKLIYLQQKFTIIDHWNTHDTSDVSDAIATIFKLLGEHRKIADNAILLEFSLRFYTLFNHLEKSKSQMPIQEQQSFSLILYCLGHITAKALDADPENVALTFFQDKPNFSHFPQAGKIAVAFAARILLTKKELANKEFFLINAILFHFPTLYESSLNGSINAPYREMAAAATYRLNEVMERVEKVYNLNRTNRVILDMCRVCHILKSDYHLVLSTDETYLTCYFNKIGKILDAIYENSESKFISATPTGMTLNLGDEWANISLLLPWDYIDKEAEDYAEEVNEVAVPNTSVIPIVKDKNTRIALFFSEVNHHALTPAPKYYKQGVWEIFNTGLKLILYASFRSSKKLPSNIVALSARNFSLCQNKLDSILVRVHRWKYAEESTADTKDVLTSAELGKCYATKTIERCLETKEPSINSSHYIKTLESCLRYLVQSWVSKSGNKYYNTTALFKAMQSVFTSSAPLLTRMNVENSYEIATRISLPLYEVFFREALLYINSNEMHAIMVSAYRRFLEWQFEYNQPITAATEEVILNYVLKHADIVLFSIHRLFQLDVVSSQELQNQLHYVFIEDLFNKQFLTLTTLAKIFEALHKKLDQEITNKTFPLDGKAELEHEMQVNLLHLDLCCNSTKSQISKTPDYLKTINEIFMEVPKIWDLSSVSYI